MTTAHLPRRAATVAAAAAGLLAAALPAAAAEVADVVDAAQSAGVDASTHFLPAFRWATGAGELHLSTGVRGIGSQAMSDLAGAMFAVANWMWRLLLQLLQTALTFNLPADLMLTIDTTFLRISGFVMRSGLFWLLTLAVVGRAIAAGVKGNPVAATRTVAGAALPLAMLLAVHASAASAVWDVDDAQQYSPPTGTPGWVAQRGVAASQWLGARVGDGLGFTADRADAVVGGGANGTCAAYRQVLNDAYLHASAADQTADQMVTVSKLYETTYLEQFTRAQWGDPDLAADAVCPQMEAQSGISAEEQAAVLTLLAQDGVYPSLAEGSGRRLTRGAPGGSDLGRQILSRVNPSLAFAWDRLKPSDQYEALVWMPATACSYDGGWTATDSWASLVSNQNPSVTLRDEASDVCARWWAGDSAEGDNLVDNYFYFDDKAAQDAVSDPAVRTVVTSFYGHNGGTRVLSGFMALVTSALFLFAIGGVAIGASIAKLGMVVMLMLLPVTLLLLAFGRSAGTSSAGFKLLKLTGGMVASGTVLIVGIALLVEMVMLISTVLEPVLGTFGPLVAPIAALFLLKKIAEGAGLGNLFSVGGSVGMVTAAASQAGGGNATLDRLRKDTLGTGEVARDRDGRRLRGDAAANKARGIDRLVKKGRTAAGAQASSGWAAVTGKTAQQHALKDVEARRTEAERVAQLEDDELHREAVRQGVTVDELRTQREQARAARADQAADDAVDHAAAPTRAEQARAAVTAAATAADHAAALDPAATAGTATATAAATTATVGASAANAAATQAALVDAPDAAVAVAAQLGAVASANVAGGSSLSDDAAGLVQQALATQLGIDPVDVAVHPALGVAGPRIRFDEHGVPDVDARLLDHPVAAMQVALREQHPGWSDELVVERALVETAVRGLYDPTSGAYASALSGIDATSAAGAANVAAQLQAGLLHQMLDPRLFGDLGTAVSAAIGNELRRTLATGATSATAPAMAAGDRHQRATAAADDVRDFRADAARLLDGLGDRSGPQLVDAVDQLADRLTSVADRMALLAADAAYGIEERDADAMRAALEQSNAHNARLLQRTELLLEELHRSGGASLDADQVRAALQGVIDDLAVTAEATTGRIGEHLDRLARKAADEIAGAARYSAADREAVDWRTGGVPA